MALENIRKKIDEVDKQLLTLLNRRFELIKEVADSKGDTLNQVYRPEREVAQLNQLCSLNNGPLPEKTLRAIFREIHSGSLAFQMPMRVAFLGPNCTFTHQASIRKFGSSVEYLPQQTIADVFRAVENEQVEYGVVPVENSTEGAVTHTLDMFADSNLSICAEINMAIHHNLLSRNKKNKIKVLYSHPQVFAQCRNWIHSNLPKVNLIEVSSTTEAATRALQDSTAAALASSLAAEKYELNILESCIEDLTNNTTRFLVLSKQNPPATGNDKTSILLVVTDRVSALYDSLTPFKDGNISLSFIESRPSKRKSWEYYFFIDFCGHISDEVIKTAYVELQKYCQHIKVLGSYPKATVFV